ncbi:alkylglycerol monooxygenase-like isoform X2 [Phymastichus coffea]|uniref:alkylglycerol monooxygenase-like isoform X2 n=1 Tax=Phymastichus coffea TaxID=108790 RepID=UPI00273B07A3|nr:alkylglycerol monooxygenase-like isoform X2 [Phymastichus coffea]
MNATADGGYAGSWRVARRAAMLLYLVEPAETSFERPEQVPDYQLQVWLPFFVLIALENAVLFTRQAGDLRLDDQLTSLSHWILQESARILFRGAEYYAYVALHERWRLCSLAWDSAWTWYITALAVDFCYYWVHRANHEVTFLWVHHQVHHSSEEFNLVVGLRQSVLQQWCSFMFYLPLALFIPPSHFVAHHQFNLIYQLWIHTTVIDELGPLEWVLNTPKHHRVHHGCNLYCLDTNYGGVLIIWDRIFGTFAEQRPKEQIIYGLVVSPQTHQPLYLQVSSRVKFRARVPAWQSCYIALHFCLVLHAHVQLYDEPTDARGPAWLGALVNNVCALTTIGLLLDHSAAAGLLELARCCGYLCLLGDRQAWLPGWVYAASCCLWLWRIGRALARRTR